MQPPCRQSGRRPGWPLEVHVAPVCDVLTLDELNDEERWDLALHVLHLQRGNAFFDKGDVARA